MPHKILAGMLVWLLIVIAPLTIAATKARAGDPLFILQEKLLASDADPSAELGYSLILSDDAQILVVGARLQDVGSHNDQGQVYIFRRNGHSWTEVQRLVASDGAANDQFGFSLAIADAPNYTLVVGVPNDDTGSDTDLGAAYLFTFDGSNWSEHTKLTATDPLKFSNDERGTSVAISGDGNTAFIGAPGVSGSGGSQPGAVYIFAQSDNTWSQIHKITGPSASAAGLGSAMTLASADQILLVKGLYAPSGPLLTYGVVHVYQQVSNVWTEIDTLIPSDSQEFDAFGAAIAATADASTVLIGAPGNEAGKVFVFAKSASQWLQQATLTRPSGAIYSFFGDAIALDSTGTQAAVGAWLNGSGGIYRFRATAGTWQFVQTLVTPDDRQEHLGFSIAMSGDASTIIGGARAAHPDTTIYDPIGGVYVYMPGQQVFLPLINRD